MEIRKLSFLHRQGHSFLIAFFFKALYSHWDQEQTLEQPLQTRVSLLPPLRAPSPAAHAEPPRSTAIAPRTRRQQRDAATLAPVGSSRPTRASSPPRRSSRSPPGVSAEVPAPRGAAHPGRRPSPRHAAGGSQHPKGAPQGAKPLHARPGRAALPLGRVKATGRFSSLWPDFQLRQPFRQAPTKKSKGQESRGRRAGR